MNLSDLLQLGCDIRINVLLENIQIDGDGFQINVDFDSLDNIPFKLDLTDTIKQIKSSGYNTAEITLDYGNFNVKFYIDLYKRHKIPNGWKDERVHVEFDTIKEVEQYINNLTNTVINPC